MNLQDMGRRARAAARRLALLTTEQKNEALLAIAAELEKAGSDVLQANAADCADAAEGGAPDALLDRLLLNEDRLRGLAADVRKVVALPDPVGEEFDGKLLPSGLRLIRRRVPIGVIGVIYEARPNVTVDIASLCLKTGNATMLRGGTETLRSNRELVRLISRALQTAGVPVDGVQYLDDPDRKYVRELLRLDRWVDMIVPRGGAGLHRLCIEESTIPVITGGLGICHIYVDDSADLERAVAVIENAKVQRPSVCNALDTLLVHAAVAPTLLPMLTERLAPRGVQFKADERALPYLKGGSAAPAGAEDFDTEWLSLTLSIRVVDDLETAITHIQEHSTEHSDTILTGTIEHARRFVDEVNSAAVYVNASTRFTDGGQFGLGAEVAVSTQKLHARGPMGLESLTTYKWIGYGDYTVRS